MAVSAFVLHVADHESHDIGKTSSSLDRKARVTWAVNTARRSPMVKNGTVKMLRLDVQAGTINGNSNHREHAEIFSKARIAAARLLPLMAKASDARAPSTALANLSKKLGQYDLMKNDHVEKSAKFNDNGVLDSVQQWISTPMVNVAGSKRAVWAMIVASVFASELSEKEGVPVVVLGRPPGHHATCGCRLDLDAPLLMSPGGLTMGMGHTLEGGCFYPNCWVAAVHSLRENAASRIAYIDIDAHKPDGIWKEVEALRSLGKQQRTMILGKADRCEGVLFSSVHIDDYPNPDEFEWKSVDCVLPKGPGKAFPVTVLEELLPKGLGSHLGVDGTTRNAEVLKCYDHWQKGLLSKLSRFKPNGVFVGLGFDLHAAEKQIRGSKRKGIGIKARHYRELLAALPAAGLQKGPVVLTLEGGYTKEAVTDGMRGVLDGLVQLSKARAKTQNKSRASQAEKASIGDKRKRTSSDASAKLSKKRK